MSTTDALSPLHDACIRDVTHETPDYSDQLGPLCLTKGHQKSCERYKKGDFPVMCFSPLTIASWLFPPCRARRCHELAGWAGATVCRAEGRGLQDVTYIIMYGEHFCSNGPEFLSVL